MKCDEIKKLLSPYIDGELTAENELRVEKHINACRECAFELEKLHATWALLDKSAKVEAPPFFAAKVKHRIDKKSSQKHAPQIIEIFLRRVPLTAAVTAGLIAGLFLGRYLGEIVHYNKTLTQENNITQEIISSVDEFTAYPPQSLSETYVALLENNNE